MNLVTKFLWIAEISSILPYCLSPIPFQVCFSCLQVALTCQARMRCFLAHILHWHSGDTLKSM